MKKLLLLGEMNKSKLKKHNSSNFATVSKEKLS